VAEGVVVGETLGVELGPKDGKALGGELGLPLGILLGLRLGDEELQYMLIDTSSKPTIPLFTRIPSSKFFFDNGDNVAIKLRLISPLCATSFSVIFKRVPFASTV
jgi:hypothetical protein